MDVFLQKRPSLFKLTNDHTSTWLDDHNSDLGSATADGGGDSADDGGVFDDDASSVDSVEATTPGPGDFYEQLPDHHGACLRLNGLVE